MKPGFKFFSFTSVAVLLSCSWCVVKECSAVGSFYTTEPIVGVLWIFSTILSGSQYASALPPSLFRKRLGSPMPQIGRPISLDDDDSDEEEEDLLDNESQPRIEPRITPMNRDQCLAKLLCGMSVPVTGGNSKKNYYNEYANIVSKFFEAFPLDDEHQSKESIETYDDYSNEDDGKPNRMNSKRKPLNSSRVEATAPTLQLFDLALVDVAKPEDMARNRTRKAAYEKVSTGNRIARARRIVENLGQKLQTVRQCQSIAGCPFTFKQLREKLKKKEAQRISSNVQLPPGPMWSASPKRKEEPMPPSFQPKPYIKPNSRPRPLPPTPKPESIELFSPEEPLFPPYKDTNKGDDEMEEIFGPPPVSKRPGGFHQGVDENYNYEYNPEKPWRPGSTGGNSYGIPPWKTRPRPQPQPFSRPNNNNNNNREHNRMPPRPRPRPGGNNNPPPSQKRYPPQNHNQQQNRRPPPKPMAQPQPKKPTPAPTTTTTTPRSPFPKKKISYLNSAYNTPNMNGEDDEGSEDINKVAPVELIGNADAGEPEIFKKKTTTAKPEEVTESSTSSSKKKKKKDDDSEEYDDDDNYDDDYDEDEDELDEEDEDYSEEEEDDKAAEAKKKKEKKKKAAEKRTKKKVEKKKEEEDEEEEEEVNKKDPKKTAEEAKLQSTVEKIQKYSQNQYHDDETEDVHEIWTKLNYATTGGADQKPPQKLKKKETPENKEGDEKDTAKASEEEDPDADEEEDEDEDEEVSKTSKGSQKNRASTSSASSEDDDELDEENASKPKRYKTKSKSKNKVKSSTGLRLEDEPEADIVEKAPAKESGKKEAGKGKPSKKTKKNKKKKKKGSSEEDDSDAARRKQFMMEIGGRPLVPKPEQDQTNTHKTSSLISNRFKFQFINPYGAAPPSDVNLPGAYVPYRTSFGPTPSPSDSIGSAAASAVSSLPFKFKLNPGPLGNLGGGSGMVPLGGFPNFGSSSSASGSVELPDPHHPPPSSGYFPPPPQSKQQQHQQRHEHFSPQPSLAGGSIGGSGLFKLNPIPALTNLFKRPSSSGFDPMKGLDGNGPPPANAFIHRPIGPESSHYNREKPPSSPASGSSNPASSKGSAKKSAKKASKGRKGKL